MLGLLAFSELVGNGVLLCLLIRLDLQLYVFAPSEAKPLGLHSARGGGGTSTLLGPFFGLIVYFRFWT